MLKARPAVQTLQQYHPPLAGRTGLRLDFNENVFGCSPRVLERLARLNREDLARYPERAPVEAAVASFLGVAPEQLLLTNGVDEGIHLLCETYLEPQDEVLIVVPTYSLYAIYAAAAGTRVVTVPAREFRFPTRAVLSNITQRTRLIAIANPNNPTGTLASPSDLLEIARSAPQSALLVDEAYYEFCGQTLLAEVAAQANVFLARTFSKAYGLAGLRCGVLVGPEEHMRLIRRVASPYNVNQVALMCLPEALADQAYVRWYVDEVKQGRLLLERKLEALNIRYCPSHANFVLASFAENKDAFLQAMKERGILLRDRSSDPGCQGWVRITLGSLQQTHSLLEAVREVVQEMTRELSA
jgi:histidinol-phosphate aminotransferase